MTDLAEHWVRTEARFPRARRLRASRIPEQFHGLSWDDYRDTTTVTSAEIDSDGRGPESLKQVLQAYADGWAGFRADGDGLVLVGPPGAGKTSGLALVAMSVMDHPSRPRVRFADYAGLAQRQIGLFALEKEAERTSEWHEHDLEELHLQVIKFDCDLLVLTDIGKEHRTASGFSDDLLDQILRRRVAEKRPTLLDSNLPVETWSRYNVSMPSFAYEVGEVLSVVDYVDQRRASYRPGRHARRRT